MIREAKKEDINRINKLGLLVNPSFLLTYDIEKYINNDNYIILVDENVDSFLIIRKNIDFYELEMIVVDKNYRKLGFASNLINHFIKNYGKIGESIFLEVRIDNEAAINLYQKYGFEIINTRKNYYKDIDAYVMKKVI